MSASKIEWERYLRECDYQPGDCVMYLNVDLPGAGTWSHLSTEPFAKVACDNDWTPIRVFTPDGKTQKGVDYVAPKSKREDVLAVLERLLAAYDSYRNYGDEKEFFHYGNLVGEILSICGCKDADK